MGQHRAMPQPWDMKPSTILSVAPVMNSDPPAVHIELTCALCGEEEILILTVFEIGDFSQYGDELHFVCSRHRRVDAN